MGEAARRKRAGTYPDTTTPKPAIQRGFEPIPFCASCGVCCKQIPGHYLPEDFDDLETELPQLIEQGMVAVTRHAKTGVVIVRPEMIGSHRWIDPDTRCVNLGPDGCTLEKRPTGCRMLEPTPWVSKCRQHGTTAPDAWKAHQELLRGLVDLEHLPADLMSQGHSVAITLEGEDQFRRMTAEMETRKRWRDVTGERHG
jgi:Fe-S-cluster containining protein